MSNRKNLFAVGLLAIGLASALLIRAQQQESQKTQKQMDEMNMRGDKHMGFDHLKTTHHFLLAKDGGTIQVEANDAGDTESRDQIRGHLRHITMMFSDGNFEIPMLVHAKNPPGSEVMQRLKGEITYEYKETDRGALIQISTPNTQARQAIHEFLKFQIKEHMTGDPLEVKGGSSALNWLLLHMRPANSLAALSSAAVYRPDRASLGMGISAKI